MTNDGDNLAELARSAEHLAELRASADEILAKEWSPERSRDLLEADAPTWAVDLWQQLRHLGWADVLVDGTVADLCILAESVGTSTAPVPLVTAATARWAAGVSATDSVLTVTVPGTFAATPTPDGGAEISGKAAFVPYADIADRLLVHARDHRHRDMLLTLDSSADGIERAVLRPLDMMPSAEVTLSAARAEPNAVIATGPDAAALAHELTARLTLGWTAEVSGIAAAANAAAVDYARERMAFGRPIGAFQAIKHRLVDQRAAIEVSRALVGRAATALESGAPDRLALVALAAFWAGDALRAVPEGAIQVFGGIGYTWEHIAHVYLRRAAVLIALLGNRGIHRDAAAEWLRRR